MSATIPRHIPDNLVYRLEIESPPSAERPVGCTEVLFIDGPLWFVRRGAALRRLVGAKTAAWYLLRILHRRRFLCALVAGDRIVSRVWATPVAWHYPIEPDACVLGPLRTEPDMRRRGLASAVLQNAMAFLRPRGYRIFYIHTATTNIASQKAIARAGFGAPFATLREGELVPLSPK